MMMKKPEPEPELVFDLVFDKGQGNRISQVCGWKEGHISRGPQGFLLYRLLLLWLWLQKQQQWLCLLVLPLSEG